jgi:dihydroflavonol-4-reductase
LDSAKTSSLKAAASELGATDRFEIHSADLMSNKGWPEILTGADGLFAVAAVFKTRSKNPDEEIVKPSIEGGISLLEAAADAAVPRIVYTSSVAAIGGQPLGRAKNEDDWNGDFSLPYTYAKTEAERRAWKVAEKRGLDLRVVNPSMVWGPYFTRHTPSTEVVKGLLEGAYPAAPKSSFAIVDVRDVATIHRLVFEDDNASGRHIVSGIDGRMIEIGRLVKSQYPEAKPPRFQAPWPFVYLNALVEQALSIFGRTPSITWSIVRSIRRGDAQLDTSKSQALGWTPIPFDETIRDTIEWLRQNDL